MKIALKFNGDYVCAEGGSLIGAVVANRSALGPWETFTVEDAEANGHALKTAHGFYVSAEGGGGEAVHANRTAIGPWESWQFVRTSSGHYALSTWDKQHYLSVDPITKTVHAQSSTPVLFDREIVEGDEDQPTTGPLSRLGARGSSLYNAKGQRILLTGATFFAGPWLFLQRGADAIRPSMRQLRDDFGINCLVVFGMSVNVQRNLFGAAPFNPNDYGTDYLQTGFTGFCAEAAAARMYVYWIAGPDRGLLDGWSQDAFVDFWNGQLIDAARRIENLLLKPTNEGFRKDYNFIDVDRLIFPDFCPAAATDYGAEDDCWARGEYPRFAGWGNNRSAGDIHPPRDGSIKMARECVAFDNIYVKNNRPLFISEAARIGSDGTDGVDREMARDLGNASRCGAAMRVAHTLQGERCAVFDETTHDHVMAYITGR